MQIAPPFQIGDWRIEPDLYRIAGPEDAVCIEPKAMAVLCRLADEPGEVVTREELLTAVWPDTIVVEETLTRCISELRKVFYDDARAPTVIETIRGRGYRLLLPVGPAAVIPTAPFAMAQRPPGRPSRTSASPWRAGLGLALGLAVVLIGVLALRRGTTHADPAAVHPSAPRPVTTTPGIEYGAQLSPDGTEAVYIWVGLEGTADLYITHLGTDSSIRLTDESAHDVAPAWSPDGQQIAFMRPGREGACTVFILPRAGGEARPVGSCEGNAFEDLAWSPDGRWLAFSAGLGTDAPDRIVLLDLETGETRPLTAPPPTTWGDNTPVFAPDSRRVAFARVLGEEVHALYVANLSQPGQERRVTDASHALAGHDWTPDGQHLVFSSNRSGRFGLWTIPVAETLRQTAAVLVDAASSPEPRRIETGLADARQPSMAAEGDRLLFAQDQRDTNLWMAALQSDERPRPLIQSTWRDERGHVSPDGQRIAFISERSGYPEIWITNRDGQQAVQVTRFEGTALDAPRWSPDGRHLAFSARPDGHIDVFLLNVESGLLRQLTTASSDEGLPRWSRDGQRLYIASNKNGRWNVWSTPVDGGPMTQVTTAGGLIAEERPDGRGLLFTRPDSTGLWWLPEAGATPQRWAEHPGELDWANWAIGASGAYVLRRADGGVHLDLIAYATGAVRTVSTLADHSRRAVPWGQASLALLPGEMHLLFTRTDSYNGDLWVLDLPDQTR